MSAPPPGVYVPVPTFFTGAATASLPTPPLDLDTQSAHALHLAKCGIRGLVLLGSSGEAIALSNPERVDVIKRVKADLAAAGFENYPLIAGTATQGVDDTVVQLKEAEEAGAQWGLVLAPGYFATCVSQEGVALWYESVADKSPIPILIYHYPGVSNNIAIAPSTFTRLAAHHNIVGCKLSHANLAHHSIIASHPSVTALGASRFSVFTGLGQQLLAVLSVGGVGAIDGLAGMFPRTVVRLWELYNHGSGKGAEEDKKEMKSLQCDIAQGEEVIVKYGTVGVKEGVAKALDMGVRDATRLPMMGGMPPGAWAEFEGAFARLKEVEAGLVKE